MRNLSERQRQVLDFIRGYVRDNGVAPSRPEIEGTKQAVLDMKAVLDEAGVIEQDSALRAAAVQAFYNTSKFTLRDLRARASRQQLRSDFGAYLDGFSPKDANATSDASDSEGEVAASGRDDFGNLVRD